jgi:hypothetical protein
MAESLTEGTLRSFAYEIGDYVEQDAEIASIETVSLGTLKCFTLNRLPDSEVHHRTKSMSLSTLHSPVPLPNSSLNRMTPFK